MGKTSVPSSRFNLPGRIGWLTMEIPGFLTLLYHLRTLPPQIHPHLYPTTPNTTTNDQAEYEGLPYQTKILASLFVLHYTYRALLFPLLQPSMSPIHVLVWLFAALFQVVNGLAIGSWLAGYGPTSTRGEWSARVPTAQFALGLGVFYVGLVANYYHDEELREIRRRKGRRAGAAKGKGGEKGVDKHYEIPEAGLFKVMLYPHYFMEWVEWFGFWMAAGWGCVPARCFVVNEIAAMLPRAVSGRKWYAEKFGEERIKGRWAVIPGVC